MRVHLVSSSPYERVSLAKPPRTSPREPEPPCAAPISRNRRARSPAASLRALRLAMPTRTPVSRSCSRGGGALTPCSGQSPPRTASRESRVAPCCLGRPSLSGAIRLPRSRNVRSSRSGVRRRPWTRRFRRDCKRNRCILEASWSGAPSLQNFVFPAIFSTFSQENKDIYQR